MQLTAVFIIAIVLFATLPVPTAQTAGLTLYVKPGASGDCTSWEKACSLQAALNKATAGDSILVARGIYKPDSALPGARTLSFTLKDGVNVLGGYSGVGSERNITLYPSILTGDLNGDDGANFANNNDNSYHVVQAAGITQRATLDGFTIRGGNANGTAPNNRGAGFFNCASILTLRNLTITGNTAASGAGMFNDNSNLTIENVKITNNYAYGTGTTDGGGGMYNDSSTLTLKNGNISGNSSYKGGGVVLEDVSNMTITGGIFAYNIVKHDGKADIASHFEGKSTGGGIFAACGSTLRIDGTTFSGNQAYDGAGVTSLWTNPVINNAIFRNNHALKPTFPTPIYGSGGGYFAVGGSPVLTNVQFISNIADSYGGGADNYRTLDARYTNVVFYGNSAGNGGGLNHANSNAIMTNVTFGNNSATLQGGAVFNMDTGILYIKNSIIWGNSAPEGPGLYNESAVLESEHSILQDCFDGSWVMTCGTEGGDNLYSDPLFVSFASGDLRLRSGSPALDSGSNDLVPLDTGDVDNDLNTTERISIDVAKYPRFRNDPTVLPDADIVDRGAYERCPRDFIIYLPQIFN